MNTPSVRNLRFSQVIGEAISLEMEANEKVLLLGEDIHPSDAEIGKEAARATEQFFAIYGASASH